MLSKVEAIASSPGLRETVRDIDMKLGVTIGYTDLKGSILRQAGLTAGEVGQYL
jgi:hypothetical protein